MEISSLKRNSAQIQAGLWVDNIPNMGELRLKVRGLSSPIVTTLRSSKERAVPRDERRRDGSLEPETSMRIFGEVMREAILLDWEGMKDNGEPIAYDRESELVEMLFVDPDYSWFADAVAYAAQVVDSGKVATLEDTAKNSEEPSTGQLKGKK